jgi:transcriptional regulator with GAF, ATPase, and Fis domain
MQEVITRAGLVAETKSTVLITGDTGPARKWWRADSPPQRTAGDAAHQGELRGNSRHRCSSRSCSATSRGVYGRHDDQTRKVRARGWRLHLSRRNRNDVAAVQSKLLRVLQEREFEPLGAERTQRVDVRVIAATNRDLKQMVSDGKFQEDLYYRLNVIPIEIPPLRERREDIPVLVEHFVDKHRQRTGKKIERVDDGVINALERYDWPGNVRELENTIERAVVLTTGR